MIVVASKIQVFGPFKDANEATDWIEWRMQSISISALPLVIHQIVDPDRYGAEWRSRPACELTVEDLVARGVDREVAEFVHGQRWSMEQINRMTRFVPARGAAHTTDLLDPTSHPD